MWYVPTFNKRKNVYAWKQAFICPSLGCGEVKKIGGILMNRWDTHIIQKLNKQKQKQQMKSSNNKNTVSLQAWLRRLLFVASMARWANVFYTSTFITHTHTIHSIFVYQLYLYKSIYIYIMGARVCSANA